MIVQYGAIVKVDFRRLGLSQRKSEFFNRIGRKHEFDMMPESGRTGDVLVQPQGAG
jgi:hypothetical protein